MEPIFKSFHFTSLLRIWQFIRHWGNYLELSYGYQNISLYEIQANIQEYKVLPKFIDEFIYKLLTKIQIPSNSSIMHSTLFGLCKSNKFKVFQQLMETSSFELGHSLVNYFLINQGEAQLEEVLSFQKLQIGMKYQYLRILINYVQPTLIKVGQTIYEKYSQEMKNISQSVSQPKEDQTEKNKQEVHQSDKKNKPLKNVQTKASKQRFLTRKYFQDSTQFILLGIIEEKFIYIFCQHIPDRILILDCVMDEWSQIKGRQNLKNKIIQLINKGQILTEGQLHLLQSLDILYSEMDQNSQRMSHVFLPFKGIIQERHKKNKIYQLKDSLKKVQFQYSKFLGDCFNGRWKAKNERKQFFGLIDQAQTIAELLQVFKKFYSQTIYNYYKCVSQEQSYDHRLQQSEQDLQFRRIFLRNSNYLYYNSVSHNSYCLNPILNKVFEHSQQVLYHAQYMKMSFISMLGIINQLYPSSYRRRLIAVQKKKQEKLLEKNLKKQEEQKKKIKEKYGIYDSSQEDEQNSDKTILKKEEKNEAGRKLRLRKAHKMIFVQDSSSKQNPTKKVRMTNRNTRNSNTNNIEQKNKEKKNNKSKMNFQSSSSDEYTSYDGSAQTDLQTFVYKPAQKRRQGLRSYGKS